MFVLIFPVSAVPAMPAGADLGAMLVGGRCRPGAVSGVVPKVPYDQPKAIARRDSGHRPKQERQPPLQEGGKIDGLAHHWRTCHPDSWSLTFRLRDQHFLRSIG